MNKSKMIGDARTLLTKLQIDNFWEGGKGYATLFCEVVLPNLSITSK